MPRRREDEVANYTEDHPYQDHHLAVTFHEDGNEDEEDDFILPGEEEEKVVASTLENSSSDIWHLPFFFQVNLKN